MALQPLLPPGPSLLWVWRGRGTCGTAAARVGAASPPSAPLVSAHFGCWVPAPCDREEGSGWTGWGCWGLGKGDVRAFPGALAGRRGLGQEGCCGWEQHPPAHVLASARAAPSRGQRRRTSPGRPQDEGAQPRPQDEGAQPSPGNPLVVSEAVVSPDRARCQHEAPQHVPSAVWQWGLAGGAAPGCRVGLALVIGAADNLRLGWARALLLSLRGSCRTSPAGWQGLSQGFSHLQPCIPLGPRWG